MSGTLEPRQVSIRDIPFWLRESGSLFWRRPLLFMSSSLLFHVLAFAATALPAFSLLFCILLCQINLMVCINFAQCADHGKPVRIRGIFLMVRNILWCLVLLTALYVLIYVIAIIIATFIPFELPAADYRQKPLYLAFEWVEAGAVSFLILVTGISVSTFWFLSPLLSLHELVFKDAIRLARRAEQKNALVTYVAAWGPLWVIILLAMLSEISLILNLALVPLFAAYQYISYRHVFLGKRENQKQTVRHAKAVGLAKPVS